VRRAVVIVSKAPRPGVSKTRLVPPLSEADAAGLAAAFLLDTCATALQTGWQRVSLVHPAGPEAIGLLGRLLPPGVVPLAQPGRGLGEALAAAFASHFADGFEQVVLIGSDTPDLPASLLQAAAARLKHHADVAIGPAADGGYYLLGLAALQPGLFDAIDWSTDRVYAQTLQRASALGLRISELPVWADVDTPADLARLAADLQLAEPGVAVHTREVLARLMVRAPAGWGSDPSSPRSVPARAGRRLAPGRRAPEQ
jgi:uncharacterized protein